VEPYRLPWSVVPSRYAIRLEPDLLAGTYTGEETVEVTVREPVQEIVLNAADLTILEARLDDGRRKTLKGTATIEAATERARLQFPETIVPGNWSLGIRFTGLLNDKLHGFYRSTVKPPVAEPAGAQDGKAGASAEAVLAVTQFEATEARRAFPCWDEPAFKAVFQVTLIIANGLQAISNTGVVSEEPLPATGKKAVRFAPTIRMSTYLLAFVIGKLEATAGEIVNGVPIRIWAVPGKAHLSPFAHQVAAFSLRFFQDYYGIPYPGDKLDLIAIPDFAFGAMENLGAITFRETALLVDEATATHGELERVADVVAHEIAHMWFGDLVTMAWWNGLWLNEAFATFMEMMAVDAWKPEWDRWTTFGVSRAAALLVDGLWSSRAIEFPVTAPKDAEAMFDVLTYEKGGAVLRMLEQHLGPLVFRAGVHKYLADHQFDNAETTDLWKALGEASGQPIPAMMDGWIFRAGYPMLTVRVEDGGDALTLSQRRFTYLPGSEEPRDLWRTPLTLRVRANGEVRTVQRLLAASEERVTLPGPVEWVVANAGGHGFYRVRYAGDLLRPLLAKPREILAPIERFNLIADAWASTLAGIAPVQEFLDLTARFVGETDRNVWTVFLGACAYLRRVIRPENQPGLEALVRDRLEPAVRRLGWTPGPDEGELVRQLRGELLRAMGTLGNDGAVQATARNLHGKTRDDLAALDPNIASAVIPVLAVAGGPAEYDLFVERFKTAQTPQEEQRYLYALTAFRQPALLQRTLRMTVSGEVRTQDAPFLVRSLLLNVDGRELAWSFVKEHWDRMERLYPSQSGLRRMCEGVIGLATPALEADVRAFFASRGTSLGGRTLDQYLEQLRIAVSFRERAGAELSASLAQFRTR
jgi:puromycin-sensitive aminopeptidase